MRSDRWLLVVVAATTLIAPCARAAQTAPAAGKSWSNVMYLGGVAGVRGKSLDWNNTLTISKERIIFTGRKRSRSRSRRTPCDAWTTPGIGT